MGIYESFFDSKHRIPPNTGDEIFCGNLNTTQSGQILSGHQINPHSKLHTFWPLETRQVVRNPVIEYILQLIEHSLVRVRFVLTNQCFQVSEADIYFCWMSSDQD